MPNNEKKPIETYQYPSEQRFKADLLTKLTADGHKEFARVLLPYYVNIEPACPTASVNPYKCLIRINPELSKDLDVASTLIIHELLHRILEHNKRALERMAVKMGLNPRALTKENIRQIEDEVYKSSAFDEYGRAHLSNIAGDWDLSRYYNKHDLKIILENIRGLVLASDRPAWADLTYEQLLDKLEEENKQRQEQAKELVNDPPEEVPWEWEPEEDPNEEPPEFRPQGPTERPPMGPKLPRGPKPPKPEKIQLKNTKYVYGTFVDEHTFLDDNGEEC